MKAVLDTNVPMIEIRAQTPAFSCVTSVPATVGTEERTGGGRADTPWGKTTGLWPDWMTNRIFLL